MNDLQGPQTLFIQIVKPIFWHYFILCININRSRLKREIKFAEIFTNNESYVRAVKKQIEKIKNRISRISSLVQGI